MGWRRRSSCAVLSGRRSRDAHGQWEARKRGLPPMRRRSERSRDTAVRASLAAAVMLWVLAGVGWFLTAGANAGGRSWSPSAAADRKHDEKRRSGPRRLAILIFRPRPRSTASRAPLTTAHAPLSPTGDSSREIRPQGWRRSGPQSHPHLASRSKRRERGGPGSRRRAAGRA
jgi:hypothetical protein